MNKVILMGRLTADPILKTTPVAKQVTTFTLAVQRRFAQEGQQQADFINCVAWENKAEFITRYFSKGSMIAIDGRIQTRSWDGQDGKRQYATEVIVENAEFTGEKRETTQQDNSTGFATDFQDIDYDEDSLPF